MAVSLLLAAALLSATGTASSSACSSPVDCSYNGRCVGGTCHCYPQFQGSACDVFRFEPLAASSPSHTPGLRTVDPATGEQVSSWGGSVLRGDDGKWHMWAAEMTHGVGIKAWLTNSQVVHAVANEPDSARPHQFTRKEVVAPVFAHEPTVARAPTGEFVMFYTTNFAETPGSQCGPPCTCGNNGTSCLSCPNDQQCTWPDPRSPLSTRMTWSNSTDGPWSKPVLVPAPTAGDTNLACLIRKNSSLVCLGRPGLGLMIGSHWRDVKTYTWHHPGGTPIQGEDPMVWQDPNDSAVLHAVTHGGGWGGEFEVETPALCLCEGRGRGGGGDLVCLFVLFPAVCPPAHPKQQYICVLSSTRVCKIRLASIIFPRTAASLGVGLAKRSTRTSWKLPAAVPTTRRFCLAGRDRMSSSTRTARSSRLQMASQKRGRALYRKSPTGHPASTRPSPERILIVVPVATGRASGALSITATRSGNRLRQTRKLRRSESRKILNGIEPGRTEC